MIIVNTPHNPTGAMMPPADAKRVYAMAESVGATVIGDEAYRWLAVPGRRAVCGADVRPGRARHQRRHAVEAVRLAGTAHRLDRRAAGSGQGCWGLRDYISLSPGKLNDALARLAMTHRERIVASNRRIIKRTWRPRARGCGSRGSVVDAAARRAAGAAEIRPANLSLELADKLATEYSVMLAPGSAFGYEHHLRLGIGQRPDIFAGGLEEAGKCFEQVRS